MLSYLKDYRPIAVNSKKKKNRTHSPKIYTFKVTPRATDGLKHTQNEVTVW